jgi:hypothetical protein
MQWLWRVWDLEAFAESFAWRLLVLSTVAPLLQFFMLVVLMRPPDPSFGLSGENLVCCFVRGQAMVVWTSLPS